MTQETRSFVEACESHLEQEWELISRQFGGGAHDDPLAARPDLIDLIRDSLGSSTKTYHYVLPTQLLAKAVNQELDCHSLQAAYGVPGAFDARTVAHDVIVPFDARNFNVLGGSPEPYVNNPLRVPAVTPEHRNQQKNKKDWDSLVRVLDEIQEADREEFTKAVFRQTLAEIYRLLAGVRVTYPTPNRISLDKALEIVDEFIASSSGGDRMEAVCSALFRTIGNEFGLFDEVKRAKVNAADTASGMLADIECWYQGHIVFLVEVKDRSLSLTQMDRKIEGARAHHVGELLFVVQSGKGPVQDEQIETRIWSEFASGQNVYVAAFRPFAFGVLILLGERGRVKFLDEIGKELDRGGSGIVHRRAWADLLRTV